MTSESRLDETENRELCEAENTIKIKVRVNIFYVLSYHNHFQVKIGHFLHNIPSSRVLLFTFPDPLKE